MPAPAAPAYAGDGGPALHAQLFTPEAVAVDASGKLYIADYGNSRIRKVSDGIIETVAGNGVLGFSGDGGPAPNAQIGGPAGLAVDSAGNLFISEYLNNRIRKVTSSGTITTVVGTGLCCNLGDNGPAIDAELSNPHGIALDQAGNLYIADSLNGRVRKVAPDGVITTLAGTGVHGFSGDGGPANQAQLNYPWDVAVDTTGNVFVADNQNFRVRKISPDGIITTVAGGPASPNFQTTPMGVALDASGNLFVSSGWIWQLALDATISPLSVLSPPGGSPLSQIGGNGLAIDSHDRIFVVNGNVIQVLERQLPSRPAR